MKDIKRKIKRPDGVKTILNSQAKTKICLKTTLKIGMP